MRTTEYKVRMIERFTVSVGRTAIQNIKITLKLIFNVAFQQLLIYLWSLHASLFTSKQKNAATTVYRFLEQLEVCSCCFLHTTS